MTYDLLVPFGILLALVIYQIYTRSKFEKEILVMYEKKFEEWKQTSSLNPENSKTCKELVGLVFKEGYNVKIQLLDESVKTHLEKGKFSIKDR